MTEPHRELDALLRSAAERDWRKVAMVLAKAKGLCEARKLDVTYETLAARIAEMVNDGRLEAQGDVARWRCSEIRLPEPAQKGDV